MLSRTVLCVAVAGCGFQSRASSGLVPPNDGAVADGRSDSSPIDAQTGCLQHWLDHDLVIAAPAALPVPDGTPNGNVRDPWVSADGLRLYLSFSGDVYLATRASVSDPFPAATKLDALSPAGSEEDRPALSGDEDTIVLSSNQLAGRFEIFSSTRTTPQAGFGAANTTHLNAVNGSDVENHDPFLSTDGLRLYLAPAPTTAPGAQYIASTSRPPGGDFGTPAPVPIINGVASIDADPALSLDERIIVFSSTRTGVGATDLWYATRPSLTENFGPPVLIPTVNGSQDDGDPFLTADGCELYFASTRGGINYALFSAQVAR